MILVFVGCKDIDDALHCTALPNGNYEVGVRILNKFFTPSMHCEVGVGNCNLNMNYKLQWLEFYKITTSFYFVHLYFRFNLCISDQP